MLPQIIALTALWVLVRPGGRLIAATVLAVVVVFLLVATGTTHMYGRYWLVPLHLGTALLMVAWAGVRRRPAQDLSERPPVSAGGSPYATSNPPAGALRKL